MPPPPKKEEKKKKGKLEDIKGQESGESSYRTHAISVVSSSPKHFTFFQHWVNSRARKAIAQQ